MQEKENKFVSNFLDIAKPLYHIQRFLSLSPYKCIGTTMASLSRKDQIYGYIQITLTVCAVVSSVTVNFFYNYSKHSVHITTLVLNLISSCLETALVIISIRLNITKHPYLMASFFSNIRSICINIRFSSEQYTDTILKMLAKCFIVIFGVITIAALDIWVSWNTQEFIAVLCQIYHYWLYFYELIIFIQIEVRVNLIKQILVYMNKILLENSLDFGPNIDEATEVKSAGTNFEKKFNINKTVITHNMLCELITIINKIHGVQILAIISSLILTILSFLDKGIIIVQDKSENTSGFRYGAVLIQLAWSSSLLIVGIILSSRCSLTLRYANDTRVISQKLLLQDDPLPHGNKSDNRIFKHQLQMLANSDDIPTFSAAGFFSVDFTLIYEVMGAVTTYFIVLLQFAGVTS